MDDVFFLKNIFSMVEKQIKNNVANGVSKLEFEDEQKKLFVGFGDLLQRCQELYKYIIRIEKYKVLYNDEQKINSLIKDYYPGEDYHGITISSFKNIRELLERADFFGAFFDFCVEKSMFMLEQEFNNDMELLDRTLTVISDTSSHEERDIDFISKLVRYSGIDNTFILGTNNKNDASNYGKMGESVVNYYLKWFCGKNHYVMINKGKPARLYNKDFINESQEIDHIIVGEKGIFLIETKNFKGRVSLAKSGVLLQEKKNSESMKIDIGFQIERHHSLIESIVGNDVPIIDILCFAHPECTIEDNKCEDFVTLPIAELRSFLSDYQGNSVLSENEVKEYVSVLESHIVD
ncbi:MAG: NERD domain-containing protein [Lachnospiraceae bacterium]|nr:NERD domain-containing protein [Lachnospiraceae bacterium]